MKMYAVFNPAHNGYYCFTTFRYVEELEPNCLLPTFDFLKDYLIEEWDIAYEIQIESIRENKMVYKAYRLNDVGERDEMFNNILH